MNKLLLGLLFTSCAPSLRTLPTGLKLIDPHHLVDMDEFQCVLDVVRELHPAAFEDTAMVQVTIDGGDYVRCGDNGKQYNGCYYCRTGRIELAITDVCLGNTAMAHEFMHFLQERTLGVCDAHHRDPNYWDPITGLAIEARILARKRCCGWGS